MADVKAHLTVDLKECLWVVLKAAKMEYWLAVLKVDRKVGN